MVRGSRTVRRISLIGAALVVALAAAACTAPPPPPPTVVGTTAPPPPARPQEPKPPYPYRAEDVTYPSAKITLAGTLTLPDGPGPFPAVLMITGSGQQDRDETTAGHKPFLVLADALTRAGIAVLRVDDRGVGGSGGDLAESDTAASSDTASAYDGLAADALAGVVYLTGRAEVDPRKVGLFGHSEGGCLAPLVAQRAGGAVAFVAMMAGPAVPGALAAYDPAPALSALAVPVLAFYGDKDLQVPPSQNEPAMRRLLAGKPDVTIRTFAGLNHLMQPATTGAPDEYGAIETTIAPEVLDLVTDWMKGRF